MADMNLGWAAIASIVYFSLYFLLLMGLSYYVHKTGDYDNKKSFLMALWKKKAIYGQILLHLYDTATDAGVLVEWYLLAEGEKNGENVESLDMFALFWISIAFIIVYRIFSVIVGCLSAGIDSDYDFNNPRFYGELCFDGFLGLIDFYVIKAVYKAIQKDAAKPTVKQKMIQLGEAIVESLPQIVLQSVYIIRSQNDAVLRERNTLYLVGLSLLASLFSITNKFIWVDEECVVEDAKEANFSAKLPSCCKSDDPQSGSNKDTDKTNTNIQAVKSVKSVKSGFINKWYLIRCVWRFSYIVTRFSVLSLLWSVVGGAFLGIYMAICWLIWFGFSLNAIRSNNEVTWDSWIIDGLVAGGIAICSLGGCPAYQAYSWAVAHGVEMLVTMFVITLFAFNESIRCNICAEPSDRQALDNAYVLSFIITGWIAIPIDLSTYFIMLGNNKFTDMLDKVFYAVAKGVEED